MINRGRIVLVYFSSLFSYHYYSQNERELAFQAYEDARNDP